MNVWSFTGNLGGDCETRYAKSGDPIVSFSVGVKSGFGDSASTTWARCSLFGKRGESVAPYLTKGQLVGVTGEMTAREWTDKQGQTRTSIEVRVNDVTLLGKKDGAKPSERPAKPAQQAEAYSSDFDSEVPF